MTSMPPQPEPEAPEGTGFTRPSIVRVGVLLAALVVVSAVGIAVGKSVEPSSVPGTPPAASAVTTTSSVKPASGGRPTDVVSWGPLVVTPYGRFRPSAARAGAAISGATLVVAGGEGSSLVQAGRAGSALTSAGKLPGPLAAPQVFAGGGVVYVLGGEAGSTPTAAILRLDPEKHRAVPAGTFEEPLAEAGAVGRGGSVYLAGGWTGQKYATAILRFTPPSTIALVARLPVGVRSPAVALLRHTLYVAGGRTSGGLSKKIYAVDVGSGAVTTLDDLPQPVEQGVLLVSGTKLYLLGGKTASGKAVSSIVAIDPATGKSTRAGSMPSPMAGAAAVPMGSRTVVVDGASGRIYRVG